VIEDLHDRYVCVSPVFRGGILYKIGDEMFLPQGTEYKGKSFVLENATEKKTTNVVHRQKRRKENVTPGEGV
jgi:hypothetical protein